MNIFLREMVSNAVDATQKLKTLAAQGDFKGELGDLTVRISLDTEKGWEIVLTPVGYSASSEQEDDVEECWAAVQIKRLRLMVCSTR